MSDVPSFWDTLLLALGLALFLEGLMYALLAPKLPGMLATLLEMDPSRLRTAGMVLAALGLGWMALVRYLWIAGP